MNKKQKKKWWTIGGLTVAGVAAAYGIYKLTERDLETEATDLAYRFWKLTGETRKELGTIEEG